jgi:Uma2 family endonuclease
VSTLSKSYLTEEQYLEIERKAEFKSEYYRGEMFAMGEMFAVAGAPEAHILITDSATGELRQQLRRRPCKVYSSNMRVRVTPVGLYTYPDVVVVCGEPKFLDETRDNLLNPTLIVEVLSKSTEAYDRGQKFELYSSLESLAEYLLISSGRVRAELFTRQPEGRWLLTAKSSLDDSLELQSIDCHLLLADLYEKVEFSPDPSVSQ